jgi:hypothetical protein
MGPGTDRQPTYGLNVKVVMDIFFDPLSRALFDAQTLTIASALNNPPKRGGRRASLRRVNKSYNGSPNVDRRELA